MRQYFGQSFSLMTTLYLFCIFSITYVSGILQFFNYFFNFFFCLNNIPGP